MGEQRRSPGPRAATGWKSSRSRAASCASGGGGRRIPEPGLRRDALLALQAKSGNAEGLAAFAALAQRRHRRAVVRAVIAYQTALDYLDSLTERTS